MVSGLRTSPLESAKIDSGDANPIEILLNFFLFLGLNANFLIVKLIN